MKKEIVKKKVVETIEVEKEVEVCKCEYCDTTLDGDYQVRQCSVCGKEICEKCRKNLFTILPFKDNVTDKSYIDYNVVIGLTTTRTPIFSTTMCEDCAKYYIKNFASQIQAVCENYNKEISIIAKDWAKVKEKRKDEKDKREEMDSNKDSSY